MSELTLDGLGKSYLLPVGDRDVPGGRRWYQRLPGLGPSRQAQEFWALRDVSLNIQPGTILGIIGPNGAGKSTLLKILARVTPPTTGRAIGTGRVVSLLELGAGFDPDLDARDNVVMNAALNGISRAEAMSRLPQILEFAELDEFSSAPLKHYSSGMYLRLAFSVAINMEPKILLADEILAVGDMAFQERCLQKVEESGREGLIVLFVSHDMEAIARVCNQVLWLHKGQVQRIGAADDVIGEYQEAVWSDIDASRYEKGRQESRFAAIRGVKLYAADGREIGAAPVTEDVDVAIGIEVFKRVAVKGSIDLHARKQFLFRAVDDQFREVREPGLYEVRVRIPAHLLTDISYQVTASIITRREGQQREYRLVAYNALSFIAYRPDEATATGKSRPPKTGLLAPRLEWEIKEHHVAGA